MPMTARPAPANAAPPHSSRTGDRFVTHARPMFLYVMYLLILWSIPMGLLGAVRPQAALAMIGAMSAYFRGLPEPLYALFGTGYVGYTVARQWGKMRDGNG
ncbi:MAG: hypothetical protein IH997_07735 [Proteobacteria bacterium]|nr:hypothetical protein [Pseudomonadota bacterium]